MRLRRSDLKEELHKVGLADTPMCACNTDLEDAELYILHCRLHQHARDSLIDSLNTNIFDLEVKDLLFGYMDLSVKGNKLLYETVQYYTGRFM